VACFRMPSPVELHGQRDDAIGAGVSVVKVLTLQVANSQRIILKSKSSRTCLERIADIGG
jgi:hypothetical protein